MPDINPVFASEGKVALLIPLEQWQPHILIMENDQENIFLS